MLRFFFLPLLLVSTALAESAPEFTGYYQGKLGDHLDITMTLGAEKNTFSGMYRYARHGAPIWLSRTRGDGSEIVMDELGGDGKAGGTFHGKLDDQHTFAGTWSSADGKRTLAFNLARVAELVRQSGETSRYKVDTSYPQFTAKSPFYTALNAAIAVTAKRDTAAEVKDFDKTTSEPEPGPLPYEGCSSVDVVYADDSLVSLCYQTYEYTGGAHGNTGYTAAVYAWRNDKLVELTAKDLLLNNTRTATDRLILQDLARQKAAMPPDAASLKTMDLVMNPTAGGLMFTFAPYEVDCYAAGTFTVMLPYKSLNGIVKPDCELSRFAPANENPKETRR